MKKILSLLCVVGMLLQLGTNFVLAAAVTECSENFELLPEGTLIKGNAFSEVDAKNNTNVTSAITVTKAQAFDNSKALQIYVKSLSSVTSGTDCFVSIGNIDIMGQTVLRFDVAFDNSAQTKSVLLRYQQVTGKFFTLMSITPDTVNIGKGKINFNNGSEYISVEPNQKYTVIVSLDRTALTGFMRVKDKTGTLLGTLTSNQLKIDSGSVLDIVDANATLLRFQNKPGGVNDEGSFYVDNIVVNKADVLPNVQTTPAHNTHFLDAGVLNQFVVDWGTIVLSDGAQMILEKLVGTEYIPVEGTSVKYEAKKTTLSFTAEYDTKYRVTAEGFTNLLDEIIAESVYNFSTRPEFVLPPKVTLISPVANTRIDPGSMVEIVADAVTPNSGGTINTVKFYADDQIIATITQPPYRYQYNPQIGQHRVRVEAVDNFGILGTSEEVTIFVKQNQPPEVSVNLAEGSIINGLTDQLVVDCSDDVEVKKVMVYVDGAFFGERTAAPYQFNLNTLNPMKHSLRALAIDNEGAVSEVVVNKFIVEYGFKSLIEASSSDFTATAPNLSVVNNRGNHDYVQLDSAHGTSLRISDSTAAGGTPYLLLASSGLDSTSKTYHVSTNVYFTDTAVTLDSFTIRWQNSTFFTPIQFANGSVGGKPFVKDRWYNIRFEFSLGKNSPYTVYLDGAAIKTGTLNPDNVKLDNMRFTFTGPGKSVYIDDVEVYTQSKFPYVDNVQFTYGGGIVQGTTGIPCDTNEITVNFSEAIGAPSFSSTYVALKDKKGKELPISVTQGISSAQMVIQNRNILTPNSQYSIVIKKGAYTANGGQLPQDIKLSFKTAPADFDILDSGIYVGGEKINSVSAAKGKSVALQVKLCNNEDKNNSAVILYAVYRGNIMVDIAYKTVVINPNTPTTTVVLDELYVPNEENVSVEAYVWDTFVQRNAKSEPVILH